MGRLLDRPAIAAVLISSFGLFLPNWMESQSEECLRIMFPGIHAKIEVWTAAGELVHGPVAAVSEYSLPTGLSDKHDLLVSFSAKGFLPQSKWVAYTESEFGPLWTPRIQAARVFLYSAEGRNARRRTTVWPEGTISLSGTTGKGINLLMGIRDAPDLEEGHYLAGEVRYSESREWGPGDIPVSLHAPTLGKPLEYLLTLSPFGAEKYPIHVFPIPRERGLVKYHIRYESDHELGDYSKPQSIALVLSSQRSGRSVVIATREAANDLYQFFCEGDKVRVMRSLSHPWTTGSGAASPAFQPFEVSASDDSNPGLAAALRVESESFARFPEDWGVPPIPGVSYSVVSLDADSPIDGKFWFEGGSLYLQSGSYAVIAADSDGEMHELSVDPLVVRSKR